MRAFDRLVFVVCGLILAATRPAPKGIARCRGPFPTLVWRVRAIPRMIRQNEAFWAGLQRLT